MGVTVRKGKAAVSESGEVDKRSAGVWRGYGGEAVGERQWGKMGGKGGR